MNNIDLKKLRDEIHQNAIEHGWYEQERSIEETIALIHSELSEALEEYRNGHKIDEIYYVCKSKDKCTPSYSCEGCKDSKPEGIPVELADVVIRIMDYCGKEEININLNDCENIIENGFRKTIAGCHYFVSSVYFNFLKSCKVYIHYLTLCIKIIESFLKNNNVDLWEVVRLKHEYNKTRPYRHGGKKI